MHRCHTIGLLTFLSLTRILCYASIQNALFQISNVKFNIQNSFIHNLQNISSKNKATLYIKSPPKQESSRSHFVSDSRYHCHLQRRFGLGPRNREMSELHLICINSMKCSVSTYFDCPYELYYYNYYEKLDQNIKTTGLILLSF